MTSVLSVVNFHLEPQGLSDKVPFVPARLLLASGVAVALLALWTAFVSVWNLIRFGADLDFIFPFIGFVWTGTFTAGFLVAGLLLHRRPMAGKALGLVLVIVASLISLTIAGGGVVENLHTPFS